MIYILLVIAVYWKEPVSWRAEAKSLASAS